MVKTCQGWMGEASLTSSSVSTLLYCLYTSIQIEDSFLEPVLVDPHHFDVDPNADSTYHPDADPDSDFLFEADPDADPNFHSDADPDPDPSFKKRLKPLKKC
jgi:hypothetical protein